MNTERTIETMPLSIHDLDESKKITDQFDNQKVWEKLKCDNNWLGVLGETKFHTWLDARGINHVWNKFIKKGYNEPDFIINGCSIDVKTTFDTQMWFQTPKFDYYVFSRVNPDLEKIYFVGFIEGCVLEQLIRDNKAEVITRQGRTDYTIPIEYLGSMHEFLQSLISAPKRSMTEKKMENQTRKAKEQLPPWDAIETIKPKMKWELGQTQEVVLKCQKPREIMWNDPKEGEQRLFIFEVLHNGTEKVIMSGAKSMVQGLKTLEPLEGKVALITKVSKNGKQFYEVHEADVAQ